MKRIITLCAIFLMLSNVFAQAPNKMSYQAVMRDGNDALVSSKAVGMKISVLQGSASGTVVYAETQTPNTNANGLVNLEIGGGTVVTATFASINWANGPYFIKTETDPTGGTNYTITGTSQLLSVPYALFSANGTPGPAGADGQGGVTTAGADIAIAGSGTSADPYVISSRTYTIGLWPELGGYVFRVSADGKHGLVAETQDIPNFILWYEAQNSISDPANHSPSGQNFRDWRLPTKSELNEMYLNRTAIGSFSIFAYWSSTDFIDVSYGLSISAWSQQFSDGATFDVQKINEGKIRPVRTF